MGAPKGGGPEEWGAKKHGKSEAKGGAPKGGALNLGPLWLGPVQKGGGPKFRAFFPLSRHNFHFFFTLLGGEINCERLECSGCRVKPWRPNFWATRAKFSAVRRRGVRRRAVRWRGSWGGGSRGGAKEKKGFKKPNPNGSNQNPF